MSKSCYEFSRRKIEWKTDIQDGNMPFPNILQPIPARKCRCNKISLKKKRGDSYWLATFWRSMNAQRPGEFLKFSGTGILEHLVHV